MNVHDDSFHAILEAKYARIIKEISEMHDITLKEAMDMFYDSDMLICTAAVTNTWLKKSGMRIKTTLMKISIKMLVGIDYLA